MARQKVESVENNFVGGLVTEAPSTAFPPNACTETLNMEHESTGKVSRRLGFDYEINYTRLSATAIERAICGHTWTNVEGAGALTFRVEQIGSTIYFYDVVANAAVSENQKSFTIDLNTYKSHNDSEPQYNLCSFSSANGRLVITHEAVEPLLVTYSSTTDAITVTQLTLEIRDTVGLDDGEDPFARQTSTEAGLADDYRYNLYNQGWFADGGGHLAAWDTARSDVPCHSDVWWYFRNTNATSASLGQFDTATIGQEATGNYKAPRGHYILNIHNEDRQTACSDDVALTIPTVTTGAKRVSKCAFFHNRIFYSGLQYGDKASNVYCSRVIEEDDHLSQLYQAQDPTSESLNELTAGDGAVIPVLGMESCTKLWALNNAVLVFATNGIWAITGSTGVGFRPNDYTIRKISSVECNSQYSFVEVEGTVLWWNNDGIWSLSISENGGFQIQSISDKLIKTEFLTIPTQGKAYAKGAYDPVTKKIFWLYSTSEDGSIEGQYNYERVLVLNTLTGAFYIWTPAPGTVSIHDLFLSKSVGGSTELEAVTDTEDFELQSFTGEVITASTTSAGLQVPALRYLVSVANAMDSEFAYYTWAYPRRTDYYDWSEVSPQDYTSTFTAGYRVEGNLLANFQSNYVFVYLTQKSNSSCFLRGLWDWTNSSDSNRWSASQQLYNTSKTNRVLNYRKLKVRGKGRALQLQFTSEEGKPFTIEGWAINIVRNEGP